MLLFVNINTDKYQKVMDL